MPQSFETTASSVPQIGVGARHVCYVDSPIFRRAAYGAQHPLAIPRTETVARLCHEMGWLPPGVLSQSAPASVDVLCRFHSRDYVEALQHADRTGHVQRNTRERFNFGTMENPLFAGVYERAATAVGGSIMAAKLALEGRVVYHPAGGTHHGRSNRASGFCYFNDPVFCLLTLLDAGIERVLYVDIDAHHGDGVEDAFKSDSRVCFVSLHEALRWPHSGATGLSADGRVCNLAVPGGLNDAEFNYLLEHIVQPFARAAAPQALVVTCGADALAGDPLSSMALSNHSLWQAVEGLLALSGSAVVLGGGGYNPWTLARCWAGLWARLADFEIPTVLENPAREILAELECDLIDDEDIRPEWLTSITDPIRDDVVRAEIFELAASFDG